MSSPADLDDAARQALLRWRLALGPGAESRIPMAITVIGGVIVSTFFTLLVVPCAYSLMTRLESKSHPEAAHL